MLTVSRNHCYSTVYHISGEDVEAAKKRAKGDPVRVTFADRLWQCIANLFPKNAKEEALEQLTNLYRLQNRLKSESFKAQASTEKEIFVIFKKIQALAKTESQGNFVFESNKLFLKTDNTVQLETLKLKRQRELLVTRKSDDNDDDSDHDDESGMNPQVLPSADEGNIFDITFNYLDGVSGELNSAKNGMAALAVPMFASIRTAINNIDKLTDNSSIEEIQASAISDQTTLLKLRTHQLALKCIGEIGAQFGGRNQKDALAFHRSIEKLLSTLKGVDDDVERNDIRLRLIHTYRISCNFMKGLKPGQPDFPRPRVS